MFYPRKLQKTANNTSQIGQQIAGFFKNLAQPTSVNNAVRPKIMQQVKDNMVKQSSILPKSKLIRSGLGIGVGGALGNEIYDTQQKQKIKNFYKQRMQASNYYNPQNQFNR